MTDMAKNTAEAIRTLREALGKGDAKLAWTYIEPILRFPDSQSCSPDELAATWAFFEKASVKLEFGQLAPLISASRARPDDPATLLILGQGLLDHGLHALAATPLTHAKQLVEETSTLAVDLSIALNAALQHARTPLLSEG